MKRHYNWKLFLIGFLMNTVRLFFIVIPALILLVVGIWVLPCLYIGFALLAIALIIALVQQLAIKHTAETTDDPKLVPLAEAVCSDDWKERTIEWTKQKIQEQKEKEKDGRGPDDENSAED